MNEKRGRASRFKLPTEGSDRHQVTVDDRSLKGTYTRNGLTRKGADNYMHFFTPTNGANIRPLYRGIARF